MADLHAIRGRKPKAMAEARILECKACQSRSVIETRVGVAVDKQGKVIHRGTLVRKCADCGRVVE